MTVNDVPRRINQQRWVDAERAIYHAAQEVERMPADPLLTEAGQLLAAAREKVAAYVDSAPPREDPPPGDEKGARTLPPELTVLSTPLALDVLEEGIRGGRWRASLDLVSLRLVAEVRALRDLLCRALFVVEEQSCKDALCPVCPGVLPLIEEANRRLPKVDVVSGGVPVVGQPLAPPPRPEPNTKLFPVLLSYAEERVFPDCPRAVPWSLLAPHEPQALAFHSQTLERLASRGGLGVSEIRCVVTGVRGWTRVRREDVDWLKAWVAAGGAPTP